MSSQTRRSLVLLITLRTRMLCSLDMVMPSYYSRAPHTHARKQRRPWLGALTLASPGPAAHPLPIWQALRRDTPPRHGQVNSSSVNQGTSHCLHFRLQRCEAIANAGRKLESTIIDCPDFYRNCSQLTLFAGMTLPSHTSNNRRLGCRHTI